MDGSRRSKRIKAVPLIYHHDVIEPKAHALVHLFDTSLDIGCLRESRPDEARPAYTDGVCGGHDGACHAWVQYVCRIGAREVDAAYLKGLLGDRKVHEVVKGCLKATGDVIDERNPDINAIV